jgi:hypothetical protein
MFIRMIKIKIILKKLGKMKSIGWANAKIFDHAWLEPEQTFSFKLELEWIHTHTHSH